MNIDELHPDQEDFSRKVVAYIESLPRERKERVMCYLREEEARANPKPELCYCGNKMIIGGGSCGGPDCYVF